MLETFAWLPCMNTSFACAVNQISSNKPQNEHNFEINQQVGDTFTWSRQVIFITGSNY